MWGSQILARDCTIASRQRKLIINTKASKLTSVAKRGRRSYQKQQVTVIIDGTSLTVAAMQCNGIEGVLVTLPSIIIEATTPTST